MLSVVCIVIIFIVVVVVVIYMQKLLGSLLHSWLVPSFRTLLNNIFLKFKNVKNLENANIFFSFHCHSLVTYEVKQVSVISKGGNSEWKSTTLITKFHSYLSCIYLMLVYAHWSTKRAIVTFLCLCVINIFFKNTSTLTNGSKFGKKGRIVALPISLKVVQ